MFLCEIKYPPCFGGDAFFLHNHCCLRVSNQHGKKTTHHLLVERQRDNFKNTSLEKPDTRKTTPPRVIGATPDNRLLLITTYTHVMQPDRIKKE